MYLELEIILYLQWVTFYRKTTHSRHSWFPNFIIKLIYCGFYVTNQKNQIRGCFIVDKYECHCTLQL